MAKQFTLKTHGAKLYKWSPLPNNKRVKEKQARPYFCTATPGSHGQDWVTTYTYDTILINSILEREAYVECDYVE